MINNTKMKPRHGITEYIVQPEDTLWNIAKRYHTTEQMIIGTNALKTSQVQPGEKLMIVKSMGE